MSNIKASHIKAKVLFVIAIVGLFAILWKFGSEQNPHSDLNLTKGNNYSFAADSCKNFTGIEKAKCYFEEGNLNMSLKVCENLSGGDKDECLGRIALYVAKEDYKTGLSICDKMQYPSGRYTPYILCKSGIAGIVVKQNLTEAAHICEGIPICVNNLVKVVLLYDTKKALELCDNFMSDASCYGLIVERITDYDPEGAMEVCLKIQDRFDREICDHYVVSRAAKYNIEKALSMCDNANSPRDSCYRAIVMSISKDKPEIGYAICRKMEDSYIQGFCYGDVKPYLKNLTVNNNASITLNNTLNNNT